MREKLQTGRKEANLLERRREREKKSPGEMKERGNSRNTHLNS